MPSKPHDKPNTSWQAVSSWYNNSVGNSGHYYHQHVVLPKTLELLKIKPGDSVLDLGCGQGVLARHIPDGVNYLGVDISQDLIRSAKRQNRNPAHDFAVADVTKPLELPSNSFSHATCILALQNVAHPLKVCQNASRCLQPGGIFVIVINHPVFRIPRLSSWETDERKKMQYRRIDGYLTPQKIPITAHPGKTQSAVTWSFHYPLSTYTQFLAKSGLCITSINEWISDKVSQGKAAKTENRSREEFPLFMAIVARKI